MSIKPVVFIVIALDGWLSVFLGLTFIVPSMIECAISIGAALPQLSQWIYALCNWHQANMGLSALCFLIVAGLNIIAVLLLVKQQLGFLFDFIVSSISLPILVLILFFAYQPITNAGSSLGGEEILSLSCDVGGVLSASLDRALDK